MAFTFALLYPVSAAILGACLSRFEFKTEIMPPKPKPFMITTILMLVAAMSYLIYIFISNSLSIGIIGGAVVSSVQTFPQKIALAIGYILDGLAQILFDCACILHLVPIITGKFSMGAWAAIVPSIAYFCVNAASAASLFVPKLLPELDMIRRTVLLVLSFSRCILHSGLCFYASMAKIKKSSSVKIPWTAFTPVITSLFYLAACVIYYWRPDFGDGLVTLAWAIDFLSFYIFDRFIIVK
jgi:hypothetical protein